MVRARARYALPAVLAAVLVATWCPGAAGQEADLIGQRIVAIEFESTAPVDMPGLERLMPMRVGDALRAADVEEARWRLQQKEIFTQIGIETLPRAGGVAVMVHVVRKEIVDRIRFEGNHTLSDRELRRAVRLRESMILSEALRRYSVRRLRERYVAEGFDAVQVEAQLVPRVPGEVDVVFQIHEGEPLRIGAVVIESSGALAVSADDIRKAAAIEVGDRMVQERQRAAEKAIVRLFRDRQYYEVDVETKWERGADGGGTLRWRIDPGPPFAVVFSGNQFLSDQKLLKLMDLPKRPIITDGTWRELARRAQHAYQEGGYYFAQVRVAVEAGSPKRVNFTIDEGQRFHIGRVEFEGNHVLADDTLRAQMATRPPAWIPWRRGVLLDDVLDDDLKRLWYFYRRQGFQSAQILDARTRFDADRGTVILTVVIDEGPRTIVRSIEMTGVAAIAGKLPEFTVNVGDPLDLEKVEADRQALLTALATEGYTHAEVQAEVHSEPTGTGEAARVRFAATPGVQQHVGALIVQNNIDTHASVIVRELPFVSGDPLDPSALLRGQANIYKLGLFRSVTVRPLEEEPQPQPVPVPGAEQPSIAEEALRHQASAGATPTALVPEPEATPHHPSVGITVSERPPISTQWGGGYNTRDGFRGFVELSSDNLQGLGRRASARGEFNLEPGSVVPNEYLLNLGFREPRLDGTGWTFRSNIIGQRSTRTVDQFSLERFALIPALERTILPGLQTGIEAQFEQAQVFDLNADVEAFNPRDQGHLRTVGVGPFVVYDARDDAFDPRRGLFDSLRVRVAPAQFGSDVPFFKLVGQHSHYLPVNEDLTFVYVARVGWARALNSGDIVPIRERLFLGGRTTVRGFGENQIGPQGTLGDPLGGDFSVNVNTELRFPLIYGFGGVVFVNGGGVYLVDETATPGTCSGCGSVNLHDFRRSAGLGLRYHTPVGPISLEYGFKLDRRPDESIGEVHFSVGTIF